ncbi:alpha/beta hydrolase [Williamsia phyllosphaerae]|uniref:alpha/beta hydrolase n=1 Tax=Williamsia phyllosphaerae TaxID=885042 RepID=UPI001E51BB71|nr:alpha/beta hydrolase-fold protein [Williamsia phyllosphaerae]
MRGVDVVVSAEQWQYSPARHTAMALDVHLLTGWFPTVVEVIAAALVITAVGWRTRRWRTVWVPVAIGVGAVTAVGLYLYLDHRGLAPDSAPVLFWIFAAIAAAMVVVIAAGARHARWWQHAAAAVALPLTLVSVALIANQWSGYYPTLTRAWDGITAGPLPNQTTVAKLASYRDKPTETGRIVPFDAPNSLSHFRHRTEYVYLPPAWFAGPTPPRLPAVVMIGGVINTPEDWVRSGNALEVVDAYARDHGGRAPILVLVDPSGGFSNDTECVDGPRGNVDTHIVDEVRPYVISHFAAASAARNWAVVGWSMGGTCAIDLAVRHPDDFATFVDISGDIGPNVGDKQNTIKTLYGGDSDAWDRFDPATVMRAHGRYTDLAGWFQSEGKRSGGQLGSSQITAAKQLSSLADSLGVTTTEVYRAGPHTWSFGAIALADALPWLHERIDTGAGT